MSADDKSELLAGIREEANRLSMIGLELKLAAAPQADAVIDGAQRIDLLVHLLESDDGE